MARKKREPETAAIVSVTHDGRGIAATEGKKVFVAGALPGEEVRFQRRKFRRFRCFAQLCQLALFPFEGFGEGFVLEKDVREVGTKGVRRERLGAGI